MRNRILTLALVVATASAFVSLPADAHAGYGHHYSGHRYGHHGRYYSNGHYGHHYYRGHHYRPYHGYGSGYYYDYGSVQIKAYPKPLRDEMKVYVNGAYVGVVDDFDGVFQSLSLSPGEYEIELRLEGYRPVRQHIVVRYSDYRIRFHMETLVASDHEETADIPKGQEAKQNY